MRSSVKGWCYEIERGTCSLCREVDSVLSFTGAAEEGAGDTFLCEHCSASAGMAWRRALGDVPPGFPEANVKRITSVEVLVARRRRVPDPLGGQSQAAEPRTWPSAYEFLTVAVPGDGSSHLPSLPLTSGSSVRDGACRVLDSVGLCSWPALCETFYTGYTPRGRLTAVVLARGYAVRDLPTYSLGAWRPWPLPAHAGKMAGFYEFMEAAWPLRLYRHCVPDDRLPVEVSVLMREVARKFVDLQSAVGAGAEVDSSMLAAYRSAMTADELAVAELVGTFEADERRQKSCKRLSAMPPEGAGDGEGASGGGGTVGDDASAGSDSDDTGGDSGDAGPGDGGSGGEGDGEDGSDSPPEPGFARSFKHA
jgi:hypothetical protein